MTASAIGYACMILGGCACTTDAQVSWRDMPVLHPCALLVRGSLEGRRTHSLWVEGVSAQQLHPWQHCRALMFIGKLCAGFFCQGCAGIGIVQGVKREGSTHERQQSHVVTLSACQLQLLLSTCYGHLRLNPVVLATAPHRHCFTEGAVQLQSTLFTTTLKRARCSDVHNRRGLAVCNIT